MPFLFVVAFIYKDLISLIDCHIVLYWFCSPIAPLLFPFWVTIL